MPLDLSSIIQYEHDLFYSLQDDKGDPEKLRREKEELEMHKRRGSLPMQPP